MTLYSSPPAARTFTQDKPTLLVCWWCTCFSGVIILIRVAGRYIRTEKLFREDWLAFASLIPLYTRMALVHVVLLWGTNNVVTAGLSDKEIRHRQISSRLVLGSRIFYAATLWMLKFTISEYFKRLTIKIWRQSYERTLLGIRWFLLFSFIGVAIADLAECQPVTHYWQVVPDPGGSCRQGYAQLIMMGTANVITDLLLVLFPIPIIVRSKMRMKRKVQLGLLFAGSLLPAGTTLFRVPNIIDKDGSQQYRSLLASVEILFATAVANGLVLGSFARDRGVKKQRWKFGSLSESMEQTTRRRGTVTRQWGSDEDLVRDLGLSVDPELRGEAPTPRVAPMAVPGASPTKVEEPGWNSPSAARTSDTSEEMDYAVKVPDGISSGDVSSLTSPSRKVSFFDIGGLLDNDHPRRLSSAGRTTDTDGESSSHFEHVSGLSPAPPRRGSSALLQDIGGLLGPPIRSPGSADLERSYELQIMMRDREERRAREREEVSTAPQQLSRQMSLQDVGGLLSR